MHAEGAKRNEVISHKGRSGAYERLLECLNHFKPSRSARSTQFSNKDRNDLKGSECSDAAQLESGAQTCSNLAEFSNSFLLRDFLTG